MEASSSVQSLRDDIIRRMELTISERGDDRSQWASKDFEIGFEVGRGNFGQVFLAREQKTGFVVALKVMKKHRIIEEELKTQVWREIQVHRELRHPNILQLFTYFHDKEDLYMVLEYAGGGSVFNALHGSGGRFVESRAAKYIYQVSEALKYCHSRAIIHRDIKPENLLLDLQDNIKLSDFGWALVFSYSSPVSKICGTSEYLPPEMVEKKRYNRSVDIWCVGILCYEFLVGSTPFASASEKETYERILETKIEYPQFVTAQARNLISDLLRYNPRKRITLSNVMTHPWIVGNYGSAYRED